MTTEQQINDYITSQPEAKQADMNELHSIFQQLMPKSKLWFLDGKNEDGKMVANPNIGYGIQLMKYADGTSREFYQIGMSANTGGISVYIIGLENKKYLPETYGGKLGKASVTGYCIKFKALKDINIDLLKEAILYGVEQTA